MDHATVTEREDVLQARAGNREAFTRLVGQYRALLVAMAFLRTSDREAAEDLVQEVLLLAWEKLPTLLHPEAFPAWLRRIMSNACVTWHRRRGCWPASLEEMGELIAPPSIEPVHVLLARESSRRLRDALLALSPENRLALLMHLWGDYAYADIARLLDIPLTTVEGRIYRAKQHLRRLLTEDAAAFFGEPRRQWQAKEEG